MYEFQLGFYFDVFSCNRLSSSLLLWQNVVNGARSALANRTGLRASTGDTYILNQFDDKLGFLRGYVASIGANKELASKSHYLSDLNYVLANPRLRRFFSSEAPKKKSKDTRLCLLSFSIYFVFVL